MRWNKSGGSLLFEGAQGTLLDIDHGTYPFVTSSNCVAGQAAAGAGVGPGRLHYVLGITKAYCTRVGAGPFPTELDMDTEGAPGTQMSVKGREFGTVTGRKRRCGWLDLAALKRSIIINGVSGLCITKLDVLDGLGELKLYTGYMLDGQRIDLLPMGADEVTRCEPIYESMAGWSGTTYGAQTGTNFRPRRVPIFTASKRSARSRSMWFRPAPSGTKPSSGVIRSAPEPGFGPPALSGSVVDERAGAGARPGLARGLAISARASVAWAGSVSKAKGRSFDRPLLRTGAQKRTRTSTPLRVLAPEASAFTNSAIWARARIIVTKPRPEKCFCISRSRVRIEAVVTKKKPVC